MLILKKKNIEIRMIEANLGCLGVRTHHYHDYTVYSNVKVTQEGASKCSRLHYLLVKKKKQISDSHEVGIKAHIKLKSRRP